MPTAISDATRPEALGKPVDWWFMYKVPEGRGPGGNSTGYEYVYCDSTGGAPALSANTLDKPGSALEQTLKQIFVQDEDRGYVLWNDEVPERLREKKFRGIFSTDSSSYGHTKGVLGFNRKEGSGFYLLHSTPKFPDVGAPLVPRGQNDYGQTFLCVTLKDFASLELIAETLRFNQRPQVYAAKLPGIAGGDGLSLLANGPRFPMSPKYPANNQLSSAGGQSFTFFGKSKRWSSPTKEAPTSVKDFWADCVGPSLRSDLNVETWRNGTPLTFGDFDMDPVTGEVDGLDTLDVLNVDMSEAGIDGYDWPFTKDHAKWGIAEKKKDGWIIIGDINRQISQSARGGGALAFKHPVLWSFLRKIEKAELNPVAKAHKDRTGSS